MVAKDIQYCSVVENQTVTGEITTKTNQNTQTKSHWRDLSIAIASQAKVGETACITSSKETAYFAKNDRYVIVALATSTAIPRVILAFMRDVQLKLNSGSDPASTQQTLESAYEYAQQHRDVLQTTQSSIDDVRQIMVSNIDEILKRNERLGLLVDRTSQMSQSANVFNRQAGQLQRNMWADNIKLLAGGGIAVMCGIGVLIRSIL